MPIDALIAARPVANHRPWPRYEVDGAAWDAIGAVARQGRGGSARSVGRAGRRPPGTAVAARAARGGRRLPSRTALSRRSAGIIRPRSGSNARSAISMATPPTGAPDQRPWLDHGAWGLRAPLGARDTGAAARSGRLCISVRARRGAASDPVGPVHAGIIEPGHFRFTANGETVARLEERLGYVHKGIDGLLTDARPRQGGARRGARLRRFDRRAQLRVRARRRGGARQSRRRRARRSSARRHGRARAHRQPFRRHRRDLQRRSVCAAAQPTAASSASACWRVRDQVFGHRLMMDAIVPGGVAAGHCGGRCARLPGAARRPRAALRRSRPLLRRDAVAARSHRTTGIVSRELVDALGGRRPCRPRLGPRFRRAPRSRLSALSARRRSKCRCCTRATSMRACGFASHEIETSMALLRGLARGAAGWPGARRCRGRE